MAATFIKPSPNHWKPHDFDLSNVSLEEPLLHITKTICLLESRCDDYAEYLQAIFRDASNFCESHRVEEKIGVAALLHRYWQHVKIVGDWLITSAPITAMDLTATVAAAGGAEPRPDTPFDGVDLLPALTGKAELEADRPLFFRRRTVKIRANQNVIRQSAVRHRQCEQRSLSRSPNVRTGVNES